MARRLPRTRIDGQLTDVTGRDQEIVLLYAASAETRVKSAIFTPRDNMLVRVRLEPLFLALRLLRATFSLLQEWAHSLARLGGLMSVAFRGSSGISAQYASGWPLYASTGRVYFNANAQHPKVSGVLVACIGACQGARSFLPTTRPFHIYEYVLSVHSLWFCVGLTCTRTAVTLARHPMAGRRHYNVLYSDGSSKAIC